MQTKGTSANKWKEVDWSGLFANEGNVQIIRIYFLFVLLYVGNGLLDKSLLALEFLPFRLLESFGNNSASMLQVSIFCSATRRNPMIVM